MNHAATRVLTVGALGLVGWAAGGLIVGAAFAAATSVGVWLAGCRHSGPLALLPSVTDAGGTRAPSRWCCHDCGATWPAALDDGHAPIRRFEGFDERKAAEAAKRATDLERRQRELAVRRAGWAPTQNEATARRATLKLERPARPVAIRSRRAG